MLEFLLLFKTVCRFYLQFQIDIKLLFITETLNIFNKNFSPMRTTYFLYTRHQKMMGGYWVYNFVYSMSKYLTFIYNLGLGKIVSRISHVRLPVLYWSRASCDCSFSDYRYLEFSLRKKKQI